MKSQQDFLWLLSPPGWSLALARLYPEQGGGIASAASGKRHAM
jgi:hypothetical protein